VLQAARTLRASKKAQLTLNRENHELMSYPAAKLLSTASGDADENTPCHKSKI